MSTSTEHGDLIEPGHAVDHAIETDHTVDAAHGPHADSYYIKIAVILAVFTAIETSTYWIDFGPFFLPVLIILMVIKFVVVVSFFMHLKFDNKLFSYLFYAGLLLAVFVYVGALATFRLFSPT